MDSFPLRLDLRAHPGVVLRRLEEDDWAIELQLTRVDDVPPWTMYPADLDEDGARLRAQRNVRAADAGHGIRYVVDEQGDALGTVGFGKSDDGFEVFYALRPEGRGRGLITAAVTALTGWLAGQGETVVWLSTLDGNAASEAVATRCGFRRFRSGTYVDGRPLTVWTRGLSTPTAAD
ncbi:GNAT family N-acetyltransferase [uncultured Leifsonia sp.]|uniref:GNAT family N-acetyltransferase n=1 Tax=uncultured Leifsonia sp. TaxID=340359 RepID=UPI0025EF78E0|nr:GNAT family N-acetyltransferase [uncultured Leifsonia sp.]